MWHGGLAAWARATFQYHVNGTDTVGRSVGRSVDRPVGRSVDARAPVDHDSVGLAQARPNKRYKMSVTSSMHNMFGASVSEVYNIIRCQFDLKIDHFILMIGKKETNGCVCLANRPSSYLRR